VIPVGVGIVFLAYTAGMFGYVLVRGYNVKFTQLFSATWPGGGPAITGATSTVGGSAPSTVTAAGGSGPGKTST